ncbi:hypothetical protein SMALB_7212 [Streptomyces malaysiensis]|uniref:Uncharacterized protein n=1 Tax=Streptomyces malaysiensis TaxID=92644 RepID=A0A7X5X9J4_STRMQ|nr:hypothetical protein [Streptomyces malaysiensis]
MRVSFRAFGAFEQRGAGVGGAASPPGVGPVGAGAGGGSSGQGLASAPDSREALGVPPPKTFDKLVASDQAFFRGVPGAPGNPDPGISAAAPTTRSAVFPQAPPAGSPASASAPGRRCRPRRPHPPTRRPATCPRPPPPPPAAQFAPKARDETRT